MPTARFVIAVHGSAGTPPRGVLNAVHGEIGGMAAAGGPGGLVAVDHVGAITLPFGSVGMYRGYVGPHGVVCTTIFDEAYRSS